MIKTKIQNKNLSVYAGLHQDVRGLLTEQLRAKKVIHSNHVFE